MPGVHIARRFDEDRDLGDVITGIGVRRLLLLLLLIGFVVLVTSRFTDLGHLVKTLAQGKWYWIVVALVLHIVYFGLYALLYQYGFDAVEVKSEALKLVPVMFASMVLNALAPTGGTGGAALFIDDAARRGESGARAAVGMVLVLIVDLATLIPFIIFGMAFMAVHHELRAYHIAGAVALFLFIAFLTLALVLARALPDRLERLFRWVRDAVNHVGAWLKRPHLLDDDWSEKNANQFIDASASIAEHPKQLMYALTLATFLHIVNLAGLYFLFPAFSQSIGLGTLTAGFAMGIVFFVISIFQGAGAVEGIMTLVYTSAGIPRTKAVVISLTYRGITFWLPLVIGFFMLGRVGSFNPKDSDY
jgi:uncharacterized protein (TIRG00374 family)